ncbi:hypothetical protein ST42_03285 [Prevotella pectinovora]|nr:hypothetical protein ST42_03285 [Prevotella pectinovora]
MPLQKNIPNLFVKYLSILKIIKLTFQIEHLYGQSLFYTFPIIVVDRKIVLIMLYTYSSDLHKILDNDNIRPQNILLQELLMQ